MKHPNFENGQKVEMFFFYSLLKKTSHLFSKRQHMKEFYRSRMPRQTNP